MATLNSHELVTCYAPVPTRRADEGPWTLHPELGTKDSHIPCGKCLGCRTANQLDWTTRCVHEARQWRHNRFLTLTYDDTHLPRELVPAHLTNFWKRLRKACSSNDEILSDRSASIRYLACGEYGERTERPHYHACLFNCGFHDEVRYSAQLSESATLSALWGYGAAKLAPFTPATAGYVAGYITKHGRRSYADEDGVHRCDPFKRQSSNPAIGLAWLEKHHADIQHGYLIQEGGKKTRLPRYYIKKLLEKHEFKNTKRTWEDTTSKYRPLSNKNDPERLEAKKFIHENNQKRKRREVE